MWRRQIKAILFDLDDTLYDEMTFVTGGFSTVARYLAIRYHLPEPELFATLMNLLAEEGRGKIFDRILQQHSLYTPERVQELVNLYRTHPPELNLFPDAPLALVGLRRQGFKLGLITDGMHRVQKSKVAALGMQELVDLVIYTDDLGRQFWKPHPAAFRLAVAALGARPGEAVYVGNDPAKDFTGPSLIAMPSVQIRREGRQERWSRQARARISSLEQLLVIFGGPEN